MNKSLKEKAVKIQGKSYVLVSDRVLYFNENYPNGAILTELITPSESDQIIIKATITPDIGAPTRTFTGYSQAVKGQGYINKTSALENSETSAVGRALAMMGIGVIESIASADEINKAKTTPTQKGDNEEAQLMRTYENPKSEAQKKWAMMQLKKLGVDMDDPFDQSFGDAERAVEAENRGL